MMTEEAYKEKLLKHLPPFVDKTSEELQAIITALAKRFYENYTSMIALKDANWTGKGLRLTADENRIFYKPDIKDTDLQNLLIDRLRIQKNRGTITGILDDIANMDLILEPEILINMLLPDDEILLLPDGKLLLLRESETEFFYDSANLGWVIDNTYPEAATYNGNEIYFLDAYKIIKFNFSSHFSYGFAVYNESYYGQTINKIEYQNSLNKIINEKITPIDAEIILE